MTISEEDIGRRAGRPRDPACDAAILDATRQVFVEDGYDAVSIEGVAARAGVGKASIYRRYTTKAQLVVDAISGNMPREEHLPDTGDLRADLLSMMRPLLDRLRGDEGPLLLRFAVERFRNPDLADEFNRSVIGKKREHLRHLVAAAIARGDLPADADVAVIAEAVPAMLWHHALYGLPMSDDLLERILDVVLP